MKKTIAIIGAGMVGLTLAHRLQPHANVSVFEKARGVGGRMSTRQSEPFTFDHGAQFFTVRDKRFRSFLTPFVESGLVAEWKGKVITLEAEKKSTDRLWFEPHYVACPGMNSLCKKLAEGITICLNCEVAPLAEKQSAAWALSEKNGNPLGAFDLVISTAPPIQTCRLFGLHLPEDVTLRSKKLLACYTMMFGFAKKWDQSWIAAKILNSPLEWIAVNSTKPGRNSDLTTLVVHSSNAWAEAHADDDLQQAEIFLRNTLQPLLKTDLTTADYFSLHRWRYALLDKPHDDPSRDEPYYDDVLQLAAVSDWGSRSRVEDVWLEASRLADQLLQS
jgi:predicted NAD/FAD-dependent oxidoreductase